MKLRHPKRDRKTTATAERADLLKTQGWVEYREPAKKADDDKQDDKS